MNCPTCGAGLTPDSRFCTHCGTAVTPTQSWQPQSAPVPAGVPVNFTYARVSRHVQALGVLWIVYAFERTISKIVGISILHGILSGNFHGHTNLPFSSMGDFGFTAFWPAIFVSVLFGLALSLLTGYALLTRQPWGRIIAIIAGVLALIHPILGTALGIYTLWVMASSASGIEYDAIACNVAPR